MPARIARVEEGEEAPPTPSRCNFDRRGALNEVVGGASTSYGSPASQSPSSLGINPQTCWESIRRDRLLTNPSTFSEAASLFDPGVRGVLRIESTLCRLRFYLHLARNSRFPSRLNLLLSFSRFTVGIPPRG